jgi:hypothetical protein
MKCFTHQLSFSSALAMAALYSTGALLVKFFPAQMLKLWAPLFYLQSADHLSPIFGISFSSFFSGLIQSFVYTYIYAWLLGSLYNFLTPCLND